MAFLQKLLLDRAKDKVIKDKVDSKESIRNLIKTARDKSLTVDDLKNIKNKIINLINLVKDYFQGRYKGIGAKDIMLIVAGLFYLVNPLDLLPDFIVGAGYIDDISVLTYLMTKLKREIDKYEAWAKSLIQEDN